MMMLHAVPETITIRTAEPSDWQDIQKIAHDTWPAAFYPHMLSMEAIEHELKREYSLSAIEAQCAAGHVYVLLVTDVGTVAYASYGVEESTLKVHKLYCHYNHHGKGYGKQLMAWLESQAETHGMEKIALLTNRKNPAIQFYKSLGFSIAGEIDTQYGAVLRQDYLMEKTLTNLEN